MKRSILLSAAIMFFTVLNAQEEPKVKTEQNGVVITYQFSDLTGKRAEEGPQELCLFVKNNNSFNTEVKFSVVFFEDGAVDEESATLKLCVPAGKEVKGKKLGLCFLIDEENDEQIKEGAFDWDINELSVEESKTCK